MEPGDPVAVDEVGQGEEHEVHGVVEEHDQLPGQGAAEVGVVDQAVGGGAAIKKKPMSN